MKLTMRISLWHLGQLRRLFQELLQPLKQQVSYASVHSVIHHNRVAKNPVRYTPVRPLLFPALRTRHCTGHKVMFLGQVAYRTFSVRGSSYPHLCVSLVADSASNLVGPSALRSDRDFWPSRIAKIVASLRIDYKIQYLS